MKKIITTVLLVLLGFILINTNIKGETTYIKKNAIFNSIMHTSIRVEVELDENIDWEPHEKNLEVIFLSYNYLADASFADKTNDELLYYNRGKAMFEIESNVELLNNNPNQLIEISRELYEMLEQAETLRVNSDGYFDYSIGHIIDLWKAGIRAYDKKEMPSEVFDELIRNVNAVEIINNPINLTVINEKYFVEVADGVKIDLGAFAKGYATQKAVDYLLENDIKYYMISSGSSSIAFGEKPDGDDYRIDLRDPLSSSIEGYALASGTNLTITTSGNYEQYFLHNGERFHHIISPKTKSPMSNYHVLSVIGVDAGIMDAYSTAAFSMNIEEANQYLSEVGAKAIFYKNNATIENFIDNVEVYSQNDNPNNSQNEAKPIGRYIILGIFILVVLASVIGVIVYAVKNKENINDNPKIRKRRDLILFGILLLIFGGGFIIYQVWPKPEATVAQISYRNEVYVEVDFTNKNVNIIQEQNNQYPLKETGDEYLQITLLGDFKVDGEPQKVVIEVDFNNNSIRVSDEKSPNNYCSRQGWANKGYIICLPNSVTISFLSKTISDGSV